MHKIIVENESIILDSDNDLYVEDNKDVVIYLFGSGNLSFNIASNCRVKVYHVGVDISNNIRINLNGEGTELVYNYDVVNYKDNEMTMEIRHNAFNTKSNVFNHGVNVGLNHLNFNVSGVVLKDIKDAICNQENRIINISNGKSTICPNLLIDSYDVVSSHAAYIGKFNDEILFYLMSRGIKRKDAYYLLIISFLLPNDIDRDKIKDFISEVKKI